MYDSFSSDYDRFMNWPARLSAEVPFLERQLREAGARRVLDAACGTGHHAIALSKLGFDAAGADLSPNMVAQAQENARAAGQKIEFKQAGFGELAQAFGQRTFDAIVCLGNSMPHLLRLEPLARALADFRECTRTSGLLIIQNRNFDAVLRSRQRWMEPQMHREGRDEWIFLRLYDFETTGLLAFHVITLRRHADGPWEQTIRSTQLRPQTQVELVQALTSCGYGKLASYGDMSGSTFDPIGSSNLVVVARAPTLRG
jgi:glycine/sarcosine N-methyltransferase